jgi:hypothetical protein
MKEIVSAKKMENGIACYYGKKGEEKFESFTFRELIDMEINALDLLQYPKNYTLDTDKHSIVMKK